MPSIVYRPTPVPLHAPPPPQVVIKEEPKVDISELKKQMKRIQNKRAIFVAGKLSGKSMDPLLKQSETSLKAIEAEISFFKSMINKTEPTYKNEVSSAFVDLGSDGKIEAETVLRQLEAIRVDIKDDVRKQNSIIVCRNCHNWRTFCRYGSIAYAYVTKATIMRSMVWQ